MPLHNWTSLTTQQLGTYTEYFVKMELTLHGFEVYTPEVDDRGIDFIARLDGGPFLEIQVKSLRSFGYVFVEKTKIRISDTAHIALGLLFEGEPPRLFLIPSTVWERPDRVFVDHPYDKPGQSSRPEWGINVSRKNMEILERYAFEAVIGRLGGRSTD